MEQDDVFELFAISPTTKTDLELHLKAITGTRKMKTVLPYHQLCFVNDSWDFSGSVLDW